MSVVSDRSPDLLVIGGGITGAAIARDAAGRGYRVVLCERGDLGCGTTSRSSRLAHGGLRYLEHFAFGMVREALTERDHLYAMAPTRARPCRFLLPLAGSIRPRWMLSAGLALYDALAGRRTTSRQGDAFVYEDGLCDPEPLTADLAADAAARGAIIRTYAPIVGRDGKAYRTEDGEEIVPRAAVLAAGPWTDRILARLDLACDPPLLAPTRGTHILLDASLESPHLLQAARDGRVFFAIPWMSGVLVGTTDLEEDGDPGAVTPRAEEVAYLRESVGRYLPQLEGAPVRGAWTGVRPLVRATASPSARSRAEIVRVHPRHGSLVVVAGGKLTTMRLMAERAMDIVERVVLDRPPRPWTAATTLARSPDGFAVRRLADLLLRRSHAAFSADREEARRRAEAYAESVGWDAARFEAEWRDFVREASTVFGLRFSV